MGVIFGNLPTEVVEYIRDVFAQANNHVSRSLTVHPSMHEPGLDQSFVGYLNACPPAFFSTSQAAVAIETHWLGGRGMYGRWEVADIAVFILLRSRGHLVTRKVALLQTKRLYSREISGAELEPTDYMIGIGRLVDRTEPEWPLSSQRTFRFDEKSTYSALCSGSEQVAHINLYSTAESMPVYYGLYNPLMVPYEGLYPCIRSVGIPEANDIGMRVLPADVVHQITNGKEKGKPPSYSELTFPAGGTHAPLAEHGWRIEDFVADEVLKCRQGRLFSDTQDSALQTLLYRRTAPIQAAIVITIDVSGSADPD